MAAFGDHIYPVFAYKNKLIVYKDTQLASELVIDSSAKDSEVLAMIPNQKYLTILTK